MNLDQLDAPFASEDIEWRIQQAGKNNNGIWAKVLAYVTNRAIMKRL
ncbi:TPA: recombinase, partial [Citrobacter freundii]|nr:recombinase [Citrobacter freundii]